MICVSIAEPTVQSCLDVLEGLDFAEVRLDAMECDAGGVKRIFSRPTKLIATFRSPGSGSKQGVVFDDVMRRALLMAAIEAGAAYVDVELDADDVYRRSLIEKARQCGCGVIISYHDYEKTPDRIELEKICKRCFEVGADIAKIACHCVSGSDAARLLGLLDGDDLTGRLVIVGMGGEGKVTRIAAPLLGSPFVFASFARGKETAPGQIDKETLEKIMDMVSHG